MQMRTMKSPLIRLEESYFSDSTYLRGTDVELKVYNKVAHLKKRFPENQGGIASSVDEITRLEVVLKNGKIPRFPHRDLRSLFGLDKIQDESRITSFTWESLREVHREIFANIKGVYSPKVGEDAGTVTGFAAAFAALTLEHNIPIRDVRRVLEIHGGKSSESSRRITVKMREFIAQGSEVDAKTLLSDKAYESPPIIKPAGTGRVGGVSFYVEHYDAKSFEALEADVRRVYGREVPGDRFIPKTNVEFWEFFYPFWSEDN
jgi:hypothetical protein